MPKFEEFIKGFEESPKEELLDAYGLATPYGRKVSSDFLKENKVENIYDLTNKQYLELAKKAQDKFGFKSIDQARDFIGDNDESDKLWEEKYYPENKWKEKPYSTFNGKEYYVRPYRTFNGRKYFDITSKKVGEDFDIGSNTGLDFETEDGAKKEIDEWSTYKSKK